jgi:meso-butanediol dehydrogenase/(S,S)-butanediol dehydrogenase/diacetyl reductase
MAKNGRLEGKVAVITGASSGIGEATALLFAKEGAKVVLGARRIEKLEELADKIKKDGGEVTVKATDVSVEQDIKELIELANKTYSQIDILVNNAGISGGITALEDQESEEWLTVFQTNVLGMVYAIKHVASYMKEKKQGSIVNVSSVSGIRSGAGGNAYSASKGAVNNLTMTTACDLGEFNVRVNSVCPGLIETEMTKPVFDYARGKGKESKLGSRCELRRYGTTNEIAAPILFLASDDASYITGQLLPVDGGNTASLNLPGMKA